MTSKLCDILDSIKKGKKLAECEIDKEEIGEDPLKQLIVTFITAYVTSETSLYSDFIARVGSLFKQRLVSHPLGRLLVREKYVTTRDECLEIRCFRKSVVAKPLDLDSPDDLVELLVFLFFEAQDNRKFVEAQKHFEREPAKTTEFSYQKLNVVQIDESNRRKNILIERNPPTKTIDAFALQLMESMAKAQAERDRNRPTETEEGEEKQEAEKPEPEVADLPDKEVTLGYTEGMG